MMPTRDRPLRVLHVTESMGAGVLSFVESISRRQADAGASVSVLYCCREDTPPREVLQSRFSDKVDLLPGIDCGSSRRNAVELLRALRRYPAEEFDVVHLHSSIAGALGRFGLPRQTGRIVYSPHGFPFLREDLPSAVRLLTRVVERIAARRGALIVTSNSEAQIAATTLHTKQVHLLQSGVSSESILKSHPRMDDERKPRVIMMGRMVYQKAPWRFAAIARELHESADFTWIGGGDAKARAEWIGDAPVSVIEWMSPGELDQELTHADVFLFPTLWEGMSLSLIQAQGRGIPAVTTNVVGNRDAVRHGVTGYVCDDDEQLVRATERLINDATLRNSMGVAARAWALDSLTDDNIGADSLRLYALVGSDDRGRALTS